jgi:preprotein translocase subunit YajC
LVKQALKSITFLKGMTMQRFKMFFLTVIGSTAAVFAEAAPAQKPKGGLADPTFIFMMVIMFAIIYFLMLRPQQKKQKETQNMLSNLKKGDKVLTIGGIVGVVGNVKDSTVMVKVAENTVLEFKKAAVSTVITDEKEGKAPAEEKK